MVRQELLVRCLDAWTPAALHHARRVTYLDSHPTGPATAAAIRVFVEFADVLAGHRLTVILAGAPPEQGELPDGLEIRAAQGDPLDRQVLAAPVFAYLDALPGGLLAALGGARAAELMLTLGPGPDAEETRRSLLAAGFRFAVVIELVADDGQVQRLFYATSAVRSLERFKDALWAVDEYAGVHYRDPRVTDHPLLDISLEPHVGPLRRALLARLASGGEDTVARLREYVLSDTLYRPADVNRALTPMLAARQITREPEKGRLTPRTTIRRR
jgi:hypothetical protein